MPHISSDDGKKNYPQDWDCGPGSLPGGIMGGNARIEWSPCSVMAFRRYYSLMIATNEWCMQGKEKVIQIVQQNYNSSTNFSFFL